MSRQKFVEPKIPNAFASFLKENNLAPYQLFTEISLSPNTIYAAYHGNKVQKRVARTITKFSRRKKFSKHLRMEDFGYSEHVNINSRSRSR